MHFKNQPPHVQRMLKEWYELKSKYDAGRGFCDREANSVTRQTNISEEDWTLLHDQLKAMFDYLVILSKRIERAGISQAELHDKLILTQ